MSKVINFVYRLLEFLRMDFTKQLTIVALGYGVTLLSGFDLSATIKNNTFTLTSDTSYLTNIVGISLIIFSLAIGISKIIAASKKPSVMFYLYGLKHMGKNAPVYAMSKIDRLHALKNEFNAMGSYSKEIVKKEYGHYQWSIENRINHNNIDKIYLCGLASIPMLFLFGSLFRNAHSEHEIQLVEFFRFKTKGWKTLDINDENNILIEHILDDIENTTKDKEISRLINSKSNEVGIALFYTASINKNAIPDNLINETLYLKTSLGVKHEVVSSKEAQTKLIQELVQLFTKFFDSGKTKIHLFISAQSTFVINLGMSYQDNMHGTLVVYNYDNNENYNWCVEYKKGEIID